MGLKIEVEFVRMTCSCGGVYAITEDYHTLRRRKGGVWHCPYCQTRWGFFGETPDAKRAREAEEKAERLRIELRCAEGTLEDVRIERDHAEARRRGEKAAKTRIMKRVAAGVCPCCRRSFQNLARHMAGEHPDYVES